MTTVKLILRNVRGIEIVALVEGFPMRNYNLFRLTSVEGMCCAVPESSAVPPFIASGRWTFGGKLAGGCPTPLDFDDRAADTAVRFNGFYLFQTVDRRYLA